MSSSEGVQALDKDKFIPSSLDVDFDDRQFNVSEFSEISFDYDSVNSPGASSTSSEPVYIRQPGFEYHAHQFTAPSNLQTSRKCYPLGPEHSTEIPTVNLANDDIQFSSPISQESPIPLQSSFFPSPPQTPRALYSTIQTPPNYLDSLNTEALKASPEITTKLVHHTSSNKYSQSPPSEEDSSSSKSRTGNHTPPGDSTSKGSKKKKANTEQGRNEVPESSKHSSKSKPKREPLPMKLRALPLSFWTQPNKNNLPPSSSVLPPLTIGKEISEIIEVQPASPSAFGEKDTKIERGGERQTERIIKVGNTDLLLRLFDNVEKDPKKKPQVIRRGRPKKGMTCITSKPRRQEDPCLVSTATESILPLLPDRTPASSGSSTPLGMRQVQGQQVLEFVNLKEGDRTLSLPSLNTDHGYSQLLSELVLRL